MARGFFMWVSSVLLGCTLLLPPPASASSEFEMQLPQVFLEGIAYDLNVSSPAADSTATSQPTPLLRVNDFPFIPSRSEGNWVFSNVTAIGTGAAVVSLEVAGEIVEQAEAPVVPAWVSILLGYGDVSNFRCACLRWFGMSPQDYRQSLFRG